MEQEVQMAWRKGRRQSVLLAGSGTSAFQKDSAGRNKGKKKKAKLSSANRGGKESETSDNEKASEGGTDTKRGRKRSGLYSPGRPARTAKGGNRGGGRSAKELGIVWPDHKCADSPTGAHHLMGKVHISKGTLFSCKYCDIVKWLPLVFEEAYELYRLMEIYGYSGGYQRILDKHPKARGVIAKLQDIRILRHTGIGHVEFATIVAAIVSDSEYPYSPDKLEEDEP